MEQMVEFIRKDCKVEVSLEENVMFKGSYYKAIPEEDPTESGDKKIKVRFLTLLKEDRSAPLLKSVDKRFIRPVPPENLNDGVVFKEGLMVDAYLEDGWWTGVVVKILEDGKYLVYFDSGPKVIQFEKKKLRVHLDWTGFKWVRPNNKELVKSVFSCGTMVELRVDFGWKPAIIIKELENEKRFIVKYDYDKSCRYIVGSRSVRPSQPSFSVGEYDLLDHVEAFTDSRWREGVVREIVCEGRYMVSFGDTNVASSQFSHSDLRPSMEWEDGVWHKRTKPKPQKETPLDGKRNKSVGLETKNVQTKAPTGCERADDGVNEKESGSHVSPESMKNQNGLGNESTRENMPKEHNSQVYTRKRNRGQLENSSDLNETEMVFPFAKKSPLWKTYESTEVFKRVPQSPHFSPLSKTKEDFREGQALGLMVTYSLLLEKYKDLETDVSVSQLHSLKDSFSELEKYGFNVATALSRIDKLLVLKDRQLNILEELKGLDKERTEESSNNRKAKLEFDEMDRKILEVKQKMLELLRQEAALKEKKDASNKKICQIESCARDLGVKLENVEFEFETTLSAPW